MLIKNFNEFFPSLIYWLKIVGLLTNNRIYLIILLNISFQDLLIKIRRFFQGHFKLNTFEFKLLFQRSSDKNFRIFKNIFNGHFFRQKSWIQYLLMRFFVIFSKDLLTKNLNILGKIATTRNIFKELSKKKIDSSSSKHVVFFSNISVC